MHPAKTIYLPALSPAVEAALVFWLATHAKRAQLLRLNWPAAGGLIRQDETPAMSLTTSAAQSLVVARRVESHPAQFAAVIDGSVPAPGGQDERELPRWIEEALRNLSDYGYLGEHPLAGWKVVKRRLPAGSRTTLDHGKALYEVLAEAIEKFRPAGKRPGDLPPKVWHAYLILHEAYVENTPNRDIMARLDLSEGTFNRRRRAALQALARLLSDMEAG